MNIAGMSRVWILILNASKPLFTSNLSFRKEIDWSVSKSRFVSPASKTSLMASKAERLGPKILAGGQKSVELFRGSFQRVLRHVSSRFLSHLKSADPGLRWGRGGAWNHRRCGSHLFFKGRSSLPFARPQTLQALPQAFPSQGNWQLTSFWQSSIFQHTWWTEPLWLPAHPCVDTKKRGKSMCEHNEMVPFLSQVPGNWQQRLSQPHAPAICFQGPSSLPFARPQTLQTLQTLPQAFSQATGNNSRSHAPAICFSRCSSLPFARLQTLQTLPQAFPRQLAAICFQGRSSLPFARPQTLQNASNPPASLSQATGNNSCGHAAARALKPAVCPALKRFKPLSLLHATGNNSRSHAPAICF